VACNACGIDDPIALRMQSKFASRFGCVHDQQTYWIIL
jgi:hypothetical protein